MSKLSLALAQWLRLRVRVGSDSLADSTPLWQQSDAHAAAHDAKAPQLSTRGEVPPWERLFNASAEPVLIIDAGTETVIETNRAAAALFGVPRAALLGTLFLDAFDARSVPALKETLAVARSAGRAAAAGVRAIGGAALNVKLSLFQNLPKSYLLVHPAGAGGGRGAGSAGAEPSVFETIDESTVSFLVTDSAFRVEYANRAFVEMVGLTARHDVRAAPLTRWLRLSALHLAKLDRQLSDRQAVGELTTTIRTEQDSPRGVAVSAVAAPDGPSTRWGFCIRELARLH